MLRIRFTEFCAYFFFFSTMPKCISHAVHILIGCSEDVEEEVRSLARETLQELSENLTSDLYENLEEKFYATINTLPRIFNRKGIRFKTLIS